MKRYVYDAAQGKVVEAKDKWVEINPRLHIITDEMQMTKSPIDGKSYYTSKRALRAHYKEKGFEEVGTDYENEERSIKREAEYVRDSERNLDQKIKQNIIDRMIHGKR